MERWVVTPPGAWLFWTCCAVLPLLFAILLGFSDLTAAIFTLAFTALVPVIFRVGLGKRPPVPQPPVR